MAILTLQRRLREAGRIRLGRRVAGGRPEKLDRFRLTSPDRDIIYAAAGLYGGVPQQWKDAPIGEQWEVILDTAVLPVVVPPVATAMSQFMETWTGGGCTRRCDGETELLHDTPCQCNLEDERTCKPTTRLNVILSDLPGIGVFRLESHGWYAATELAGTVEVCMAAATRGQLLPAVLRLEQRQVKRVGEPARHFAVPVLDVQVTPVELGVTFGDRYRTTPRQVESWQPIPTPEEIEGHDAKVLPAGVMAAAAAEPGSDRPKPRKNAPPPLPSTGVKPKGYVAPVATGVTEPQMRRMHASFTAAGIHDRAERLAFTCDVIKREITTSKDLTAAEASTVIDWLNDIAPPFPVDDGQF